jgi:hypothetical protein
MTPPNIDPKWGLLADKIGHYSDGPETFVIVKAKDVPLGVQTYGPPKVAAKVAEPVGTVEQVDEDEDGEPSVWFQPSVDLPIGAELYVSPFQVGKHARTLISAAHACEEAATALETVRDKGSQVFDAAQVRHPLLDELVGHANLLRSLVTGDSRFNCLRCVTPKKCAVHGCCPGTWPSETKETP